MNNVEVDVSELKEFFHNVGKAGGGDFRKELNLFLEALGNEFLRVLTDEIIRRDVMNTRLLLASFTKGEADNIWECTDSGLTLEVGTNVEYASYVNDGHWTCKPGEKMRFVPGYWVGEKFIYDKSAEGGMVLKQKWIEGRHYWEGGLRIIEAMLPTFLDNAVQKWMDNYFRS